MDEAILQLIYATTHGEARGQSDDFKVNVISSLLNRAENFNKHWGWHGSYEEMLKKEYYAVRDSESGKNTGFKDATEHMMGKTPFKSKVDEEDFKRTLQLTNSVVKGTIPRTKTQFYFNKREEKSARKTMDFDLLKRTGSFENKSGTTYSSYSYK